MTIYELDDNVLTDQIANYFEQHGLLNDSRLDYDEQQKFNHDHARAIVNIVKNNFANRGSHGPIRYPH